MTARRGRGTIRNLTPGLAGFAAVALLIAVLSSAGCGTSKPSGDAGSGGATGSGGKTGSGGSTGSGGAMGGRDGGSGGFQFDASGFDLNLDGFSLDGLDAAGFDVKITTCPPGTKTGDNCTSGVDVACQDGGKTCGCFAGKWMCFGG